MCLNAYQPNGDENIRSAFAKSDLAKMIIVPVPDVNDNRVWVDHVLMHIPPVNNVYSNNQLVKMLFSQHGVLVKSVEFYDRGPKEGTNIRKMMCEKDSEWGLHVPKKTCDYLKYIDAEKRMKEIVRSGQSV